MLIIQPISSFIDNYIWLIRIPNTHNCLVVDPGDAAPVINTLETHKLTLSGILVTHHHRDHTAGIAKLLKVYDAPVYGPSHSPYSGITNPLQPVDKIGIEGLTLTTLAIPGHTLDHIAYCINDPYTKDAGHLFCGDTLFSGGCGRCFEGTYEQLYQSLQQLAALPPETLIYCAHEYTQANLRFAQIIEPQSTAIAERIEAVHQLRLNSLPSLPSTIQTELETNPFLRCEQASVICSVEAHTGRRLTPGAEVFTALRQWKNQF